MNRFLVIGFELYKSFYYSLILCKAESDGTKYRITVMNGEIEKQLCNNNTIMEIDGCLQVELSSNQLQNKIITEIAKALGNIIDKPVKEVKIPWERTAEEQKFTDLAGVQIGNTTNENDKKTNHAL